MPTAAKTRRKLTLAADRVPEALTALADLRRGLLDGKPLHKLLLLLDEAETGLLRLEDAVGVSTPAALFD